MPLNKRGFLSALASITLLGSLRCRVALLGVAASLPIAASEVRAADAKLTALSTGTSPTYFYGEESGNSKKYNGFSIHNVLDYGADPTGVNDSAPAIQACVDWISNTNRGVIVFPRGTYKVNSAVTFANTIGSIILRGEGDGSKILGNGNYYCFDKSDANTVGGIKIIDSLQIVNSSVTQGGALRWNGVVGGLLENLTVQGFVGISATLGSELCMLNCSANLPGGVWTTGSVGMDCDGNHTIIECDLTGYDIGLRLAGAGHFVSGCRTEVNRTGWYLSSPSGFDLGASTFEGNDTAIYVAGATAGTIHGLSILAGSNSPSGGALYGIQIPDGVCQAVTFSDISAATGMATASYSIGASEQQTTFRNCVNGGGGTKWTISKSAGVQFYGCDIPAPSGQTYALRPFQGSGTAVEGDQWTFTDSNTAVFGATIAGGGVNRVVGRYSANGAVWTVAALAP